MNNVCVFCSQSYQENDVLVDFIKITGRVGSYKEGRYLRSVMTQNLVFKNKEDSFCHLSCLKERLVPLDYVDTTSSFDPMIVRRLAQLDE